MGPGDTGYIAVVTINPWLSKLLTCSAGPAGCLSGCTLLGMHDLTFVRAGGREAVEVTAAANSGAIQLWHFLESGERWISKQLQGGWSVEFAPYPGANVRRTSKG
jgi:hypothetical protein